MQGFHLFGFDKKELCMLITFLLKARDEAVAIASTIFSPQRAGGAVVQRVVGAEGAGGFG
jgi:hypothetical protein